MTPTTPAEARAARHRMPTDRDWLWAWVRGYTGVKIPRAAVCDGHHAPFNMFAEAVLDRPDWALWHGPRGSGKSFLSAIDTHIQSRFRRGHRTRVLGGSKAQSSQIYEAIKEAVLDGAGPLGTDRDTIAEFLTERARYRNGSEVAYLAASARSVRGPHVQSLKLDEVDEIDPGLRDDAVGMAMEKHGQKTSILMTSTWHRPGGPMTELIERGRSGAFPVHTYCVFEVLERCPDVVSGPRLENCPACPLVGWCHSDRDRDPLSRPKAKRSAGHYTVASLIQKAKGVSPRAFASDYLCEGPRVEGNWFARFDPARNVTPLADYRPDRGVVHVSVDSGVWTGAIVGQVWTPTGGVPTLSIFDEHLSYDAGAASAAGTILRAVESRCPGARRRVSTDSAGGSANPVGITVFAEYENAGLRGDHGIERWPKYPGSLIDGLNLTEAWVCAADGTRRILIHPRCQRLVQAFQAYARRRVRGQWLEVPEDPQHPHEDLIDPVRGLLKLLYPDANRPGTTYYASTPASRIF